MVKPQHNVKLKGPKGEDITLDCLEVWARRRGVSMNAAARILITKALDSEDIRHDFSVPPGFKPFGDKK